MLCLRSHKLLNLHIVKAMILVLIFVLERCMSKKKNTLGVMWTWYKWDGLGHWEVKSLYVHDLLCFVPFWQLNGLHSHSLHRHTSLSDLLCCSPPTRMMRYCHKATYFYPLKVLVKMINYENDFVESLTYLKQDVFVEDWGPSGQFIWIFIIFIIYQTLSGAPMPSDLL